MSTLYFECQMGAAGDMLMSALYELLDPQEKKFFLERMNHLGPYGIKVEENRISRCGIYGTQLAITINGEEELPDHHHHDHEEHHHHEHHHASFDHVLHQISHLDLPEEVKKDCESIYRLIGEAESKVHETTLDQIHFHEVGTLDALADVAGCCLLIHMLHPDQILCSPIHVGNGTVKCAHGILPVPAPATALLLQGIPYYSGSVMSELCTPTGAAILAHFVQKYGSHPAKPTEKIGYGMGHKDFDEANCVRVFLLTDTSSEETDRILEMQCNLDDMTGEDIAFATQMLLEAGALDVYTMSIQMKKNRPGILLSCLCPLAEREKFASLLFTHTSTRGIRYREWDRMKLKSKFETRQTPYGSVRIKQSTGYGVTHEKPEYEDIASLAKESNLSLNQLRNTINSPK